MKSFAENVSKNRGILNYIWLEIIRDELLFRILRNTPKDCLCYMRDEKVSMKFFFLNMHEATEFIWSGQIYMSLIYYAYLTFSTKTTSLA